MSSSRQAWYEEQQEAEERAKEAQRLQKAREKLATNPEQMRLDLPVPHGYDVEKAYIALVAECLHMPGFRNSDHYKTASRLGAIK